jgi:hypothetical protein
MATFDSNEKVMAYINHLCRSDLGSGEMLNNFLFGDWKKLSDIFWLYDLTDVNGKVELVIDYSLAGGGGWLNTSCPVATVSAIVDTILKWDLTPEIKRSIQLRKSKLLSLSGALVNKRK